MRLAAIFFCIVVPILAQNGVVVEGAVIDKSNGAGIAGARVYFSTADAQQYEAITDVEGTFRVLNVKPGDYRPLADKDGYFHAESGPLSSVNRSVHVDQEPVHLRLELLPSGTLRGQVTNTDGKPAAKIEVELDADSCRTLCVETGLIATTTDDGVFQFEKLAPGAYRLVAYPKASSPSASSGTRIETVPTYFPSAIDHIDASIVTVGAGIDQTGFDIRLQTAPVYSVRGIVLDANERPASNAIVKIQAKTTNANPHNLVSIGPGSQTFSMQPGYPPSQSPRAEPVVAGKDGAFEFRTVQAGEYSLRAESDVVHDETNRRDIVRSGSTTMTVGRSDLNDVRIQLTEPFSLNATIELSDHGSRAVPNRFISLTLRAEDGSRSIGSRPQKDGPLRIENLTTGRYRIAAYALANPGGPSYYAATVLLGNTDITGQAVDLTPASPPLRIILKPAATLSGLVENGPGATVTLVPQSMTGTGYTAQTEARGSFRISGIVPGSYYAIAVDDFDFQRMSDSLQWKNRNTGAITVKVDEGSTESVHLTLTHRSE